MVLGLSGSKPSAWKMDLMPSSGPTEGPYVFHIERELRRFGKLIARRPRYTCAEPGSLQCGIYERFSACLCTLSGRKGQSM